MRWWKQANDASHDEIEGYFESLASGVSHEAMFAADQLGKMQPSTSLVSRLLQMASENGGFGSDVQPMASRALAGLAPRASEEDREKIFRLLTTVPEDTRGSGGALFIFRLQQLEKAFPGRMFEFVPRLNLIMQDGDDDRGIARRQDVRSAIRKYVSTAESNPTALDQSISEPGLWRKNKQDIIPGTRIKMVTKVPNSSGKKDVAMATISAVEHTLVKYKGKDIQVPHLSVVVGEGSNQRILKLDPFDAKCPFDLFLVKDFESMPIEEYKGHWVSTVDPLARSFRGPNGRAPGILLKKKQDTCTLKMMNGNVSWVIDVPCSTVSPSREAPSWGRPWFETGSKFSIGDIVEYSKEPGKDFEILGHVRDLIGIAPVGSVKGPHEQESKAPGHIYVRENEISYVGRLAPDGKVIKTPHLKSKPVNIQPPRPVLAPKPDVEV